MRKLAAIAIGMAALSFGGGHALAFQEMPAPPAAEESSAAPEAPAFQLGTPGAAQANAETERGGINLFGYKVLPKLDFGLDVLYGQDQQQLQLGGSGDPDSLEENGDVSVLGKVKRRF
jgi:hypothetical protein